MQVRAWRGVCARGVRCRGGGAAAARRGGGGRGVDHHAGRVQPDAAQPRQHAVPRQRLLHLRCLHPGRQLLPGVRHRLQHRRAQQARARRLLRPDLPRDYRWHERCRRPVPVGLLLQGGDQQGHKSSLLWTRTNSIDRAGQLPASRGRDRRGPGEQPGPGVLGRGGLLQDGHLVLDDGAVAQAVVPRRDPRQLDAIERRRGGGAGSRLRRHHQHHQRRQRLRRGAKRRQRRPHRLLQALLRHVRRRLRRQPRLLLPAALLMNCCST
ncbi:hypothetical protein Zm00014a_021833 [Zea mays]|uniref:Uncharacterized protein n=1 Tax=Zea mays TaxID=4577 RepID=A0A317Y8J3_MAIZE|nr:hypothetical protein Zm00014a_021833 [Zea mays]